MSNRFSKRYGYNQPLEAEIKVRQDAPEELRDALIQIAYECGFGPSDLRSVICQILRKRPDPSNWSEYPNINDEVHWLIGDCQWYKVYDAIEGIAKKMRATPFSYDYTNFEDELNDYFVENGIGWKLVDGEIEIRGSELFNETIMKAHTCLNEEGLHISGNELHEALRDLSRRPVPDITGSVQHSMAALECVAREACGDEKATLGEIIKKYREIIPRPLDEAITKIWGYTSEQGRHVREGLVLSFEEAELVVALSAAISTYLTKKRLE
jgi:hypothetical protein